MRHCPSNSLTTSAAGVASIGRTIGAVGIGVASRMDTLTTGAPTSNISAQIGAVLRVTVIHSEGRARFATPSRPSRTDFAIIEDDPEAIHPWRAKIPRNEVRRLVPSVSPPSCWYGKGCPAAWVGASDPTPLLPEGAGVDRVYLHKLERDASYRGV